ncbi:gliding motility-associated C-terminal domain-containing protein [Flavobacterium sp. NG2]|uniref:T9SS type B sorting domain-containing protein n=1 Tax=Flavobacterium sp. NG2 TaxID=3097547 RepID=UPI002A7FE68C|nr:gliding motility-associated C-terminal domain-containing protein [Flavobacterium sp. NG2]WPR72693.1 gliding motility-associated C-terminal domain-containing protein [Flavobacterium sp. NG2]
MTEKTTKSILERLRPFFTSKTSQLILLTCFFVSTIAQTVLQLDIGKNRSTISTQALAVDPLDIDGDGVPNNIDLDDDNDGILDVDESKVNYVTLDGFSPFSPSTIPSSGLVVGNRLIKPNALSSLGFTYDAIVEITGVSLGTSGRVTIESTGNIVIQNVNAVENPYFTYSLKFVPAGSASASGPITPSTVGHITLSLADIDGDGTTRPFGEVVGYANTNNIKGAPIVGSTLTAAGFTFGNTGIGGPGTNFNYYRPAALTSTVGIPNHSNSDYNNANYSLILSYDSHTESNYVFGITGTYTTLVGERKTIMLASIGNATDTDLDGIPNIYDLDSDNDGCSDSNEYYFSNTAAAPGQQYGMTNGAVAPVDSQGRVLGASYYGTYDLAIIPSKVNAPSDQLLATGVTTATFTATTQGLSTNPTYKWQLSTNGEANWSDISNGGNYSGANTINLNITGVTLAMKDYRYRVLVTSDDYLCGTITSLSGKLGFLNIPPIANNDNATTLMGTSVIVPVASNDTDSDGTINATTIDLDPLTADIQTSFTVTGQGTYTANSNGTVTFVPVATFKGNSSISYVIQDNLGAVSNVGTIQVVVTSCFDNPNLDCDNDGLSNSAEVSRGTDPANPDSDGDGVIDGTEVTDNTNPLDPCNSNQSHATLPKSGLYLSTSCDIEIFNGVSPLSNDEDNRVFMIRNIEKYPNNSLQIYNRWGVVVYEANGYGIGNKYFRGVSEGRTTVSASTELPEGTYFYALKYVNSNGETKERSGYLYINR